MLSGPMFPRILRELMEETLMFGREPQDPVRFHIRHKAPAPRSRHKQSRHQTSLLSSLVLPGGAALVCDAHAFRERTLSCIVVGEYSLVG